LGINVLFKTQHFGLIGPDISSPAQCRDVTINFKLKREIIALSGLTFNVKVKLDSKMSCY